MIYLNGGDKPEQNIPQYIYRDLGNAVESAFGNEADYNDQVVYRHAEDLLESWLKDNEKHEDIKTWDGAVAAVVATIRKEREAVRQRAVPPITLSRLLSLTDDYAVAALAWTWMTEQLTHGAAQASEDWQGFAEKAVSAVSKPRQHPGVSLPASASKRLDSNIIVQLNTRLATQHNRGGTYRKDGETNLAQAIIKHQTAKGDLLVNAVDLGLGLVGAQAFDDGNHRTATAAVWHFLVENGIFPTCEPLRVYAVTTRHQYQRENLGAVEMDTRSIMHGLLEQTWRPLAGQDDPQKLLSSVEQKISELPILVEKLLAVFQKYQLNQSTVELNLGNVHDETMLKLLDFLQLGGKFNI